MWEEMFWLIFQLSHLHCTEVDTKTDISEPGQINLNLYAQEEVNDKQMCYFTVIWMYQRCKA